MEYIGQEHLKNSLESIMNKGACILIGPDKYGKTYFAQQVAKELNLEYVLVESNVENTKALIQDIKPGNLYHLKDLHKARQQVISRLLKLLEDNVPQGAVILITTELTNTIDTILSRCLVLKCKKYSYEELSSIKYLDKLLYTIYDTPTKLADVSETVEKVITLIDDYLLDPKTAKIAPLTDYDFKIISSILISKLGEKGYYKVINRVLTLSKGFEKADFIPNWKAVNLLLEDIRYDII